MVITQPLVDNNLMHILCSLFSLRRCYILSEKLNAYTVLHRGLYKNYLCNTCFPITLERMDASILSSKTDTHKGIIVNSDCNVCEDVTTFEFKLQNSLKKWIEDKMRGVWFNVDLSSLSWIPILIQHGFKIHHARDELITLCRWLPEKESYKIPDYPHCVIGAGAVVFNDKNQILVVRERYGERNFWKLPGGHTDRGEDIGETAIREVLEETSVRTEFVSLVAIRRRETSTFPLCSDMYFVIRLRPLTSEIHHEEDEIDDCKWMDIDEYLNHPEVHENNRFFVRQALQNEKDGIEFQRIPDIHPVTKAPQLIYGLRKK